ncbi:MAG: filamentous hemagglutinin N-terminal domain-containing protein, partial [Gammaproteobacteria bacterium]|nr:filamentous hemagglutinin N-terminal domain-containing protein [Gammaproteobacteria bacterium]
MNRIHRIIWSQVRRAWVVAHEHAKSHGKSSSLVRRIRHGRAATLTTATLLSAVLAAPPLLANPLNPEVVHGTAAFSQNGNSLTITNSDKAIINWQAFSINPQESTRFNQPNAQSSVLNRVLGSDPSRLLGQLQSNGKVFLVNPAGIVVGEGAKIDVGGLVASTLNISDADYLANRLHFVAAEHAQGVVNQGQISTTSGGTVVLTGTEVSNKGVITTPDGQTILAAGATVQIEELGAPGVKIEITGDTQQATNLGEITATAGTIGVVGALVKNSGKISASSVERKGGRILLRGSKRVELSDSSKISADGTTGGEVIAISSDQGKISGEISVNGEISARGDGSEGSGGFVETSGGRVKIGDKTQIKS